MVLDVGYITYKYGIMTWPDDDRILIQHRNRNFYIQWSVHRVICVNNYPARYSNIQFIDICKLLYMFRVVSPPVVRSSYHCIYSIWHYWDRYCYLSWASRSRQVAVTVSVMVGTWLPTFWDSLSFPSSRASSRRLKEGPIGCQVLGLLDPWVGPVRCPEI